MTDDRDDPLEKYNFSGTRDTHGSPESDRDGSPLLFNTTSRDPAELAEHLARHERRVFELERTLRDRNHTVLKLQEDIERRDDRLRQYALKLKASEEFIGRSAESSGRDETSGVAGDLATINEIELRDTLEDERQRSAADEKELKAKLEASEKVANELRERLSRAEQRLQEFDTQLGQEAGRASDADSRVRELEGLLAERELALKHAEERTQKLTAAGAEEQERAASSYARLEKELTEHSKKLSLYRTNLLRAEELTEVKTREISHLREELNRVSAAENRQKEELVEKLERAQAQHDEMSRALDDAKASFASLEEEAGDRFSSLEQTLNQKIEAANSLEKELEQAEQAQAELKADLKEQQDLRLTGDRRNRELDETLKKKNEVIYVLEHLKKEQEDELAKRQEDHAAELARQQHERDVAINDLEHKSAQAASEAQQRLQSAQAEAARALTELEARYAELGEELQEREGTLAMTEDALERSGELVKQLSASRAGTERLLQAQCQESQIRLLHSRQREIALVNALARKDAEILHLSSRVRALTNSAKRKEASRRGVTNWLSK